jgi:hypothetical protein
LEIYSVQITSFLFSSINGKNSILRRDVAAATARTEPAKS